VLPWLENSRHDSKLATSWPLAGLLCGEHVHVVQTDRSAHEFSLATFSVCGNTSRCVSVCPPHACRLRRPASGKNKRCGRLMNFMRNIGQSVGTSAVTTLIAGAVSIINPCWRVTPLPPVSRRYYSTHDATDDCRLERMPLNDSTGPNVRASSVSGRGSLLR